jgi:hypothetical protein
MKTFLTPIRSALLAAITLSSAPVFASPQRGAPIATTSPATGLSPCGAALNALVNADGLATTAWFQWGIDTNYGNLTSTTNMSATWGNYPVSAMISNLTPGLTWHFRAVASNSMGVATGSDMTFVTPLLFTNLNAGLPIITQGTAASGDCDNDGRLDILLTGYVVSGNPALPTYTLVSQIYHNDGNGVFTLNAGAVLPGVRFGSVAWGDYDNDGRLDLLLAGFGNSGAISQIYHNNGDGTFTLDPNAALPGVYNGSVAWGDYDNDGRLDFLLTGDTGYQDTNGNEIYISQVYHNNGDGSFALNTNVVLPGVAYGSVAWGDFDNNGRLDILLTGQTGVDTNNYPIVISQIYHNNGDGTFTLDTNAVLPGVYTSSVACGDYDNDGWLDILLTGDTGNQDTNGNEIYISQVFHNNGDGTFALDTNAVLPGLTYCPSVAWGDYDNDGRLDILLTGDTGTLDTNGNGIYISQVYHNNGGGSFTLDTNVALPGIYGYAAWGDYENDGRLDILLVGATAMQNQYGNDIGVSSIYRNLCPITNNPPTAPTGLTASVSNNYVSLAWAAATDAQTPAAGLTYNLRIGSTPGGSDLLSPESDITNGFRLLAQVGNTQLGTNAIVDISAFPADTTCYWSVQAVDSGWAGSVFAAEGSFYVPGPPEAITLPVTTVAFGQATLQGSVNPGGLSTLAWFEWGTDTNYGNFTPVTVLSSTNASVPLSAALGNLTPGWTYHFRVAAANSAGDSIGSDGSFTTALPPSVVTLAPGSVSLTGATLDGTVNPNGLPATAWFRWGTDTNYGNVTATTNLAVTNSILSVSAVLGNLTPGWTYHYCVAAASGTATNYGGDLAFRTSGGTNYVTSLADNGAGSLRQTIAASEAGDIICFSTNGIITLTNGELEIAQSLTITGPGATNLILSGNGSSRVININNSTATVSIACLTVCNGQAPGGAAGASGSFYSPSGGNGGSGSSGGGIYNLGNLTLSHCILTGNAAGAGGAGGPSYQQLFLGGTGGSGGNGGGVYSAGPLTLTGCAFATNSAGIGGYGGSSVMGSGAGGAGGSGGGVYSASDVTLNESTFSANAAGSGNASGAGGDGGGICCAGVVTLTACTFSSNTAGNSGQGGSGGYGGGIYSSAGAASATLHNGLFAGNLAGSVAVFGVAGSGPDLCGAFTSQGYNLVGDAGGSTGVVNGANGDLAGTSGAPINPLLAPLTDNGGATLTLAFQPASPAFNAGDDTLTGTDQRGFPRNAGGRVDIGAFELQIVQPVITSVSCTVTDDAATGLPVASITCVANPNGLNTSLSILYGATTNYGAVTVPGGIGGGCIGVSTNVLLTGLAPAATYHYCVAASNYAGTVYSADETFASAFALTLPATAVTTNQATLEGSVSPGGTPTMAWFQWGATAAYGNFTPASNLGSGNQALAVSNSLTGLTFGTTYHFQVVAFNQLGFMLGADHSFTTPDASRTITACCLTAAGQFQFQFTGAASSTYTVLCSTNLALPLSNWTPVGIVTETSPGQYQFTDPAAMTNQPQRFYLLRQP